MNFPAELRYTKDHEWVRTEGDVVYVGITDFAQRELGDIVYVDITAVGKTISQHDVFGTVEAVKTVSDLFSPLSGKVLEVNPTVQQEAAIVNTDPYQKGWMIKMSATDPSQVASLLTADAYKKLIGV